MVTKPQSPATSVPVTQNRKVGIVSITATSQASCPDDCPFRGNGCYAESGRMAFVTRRLNGSTETDRTKIAEAEAEAIDRLPGRLPLRLHTVGDCATPEAAKIVASASERYMAKRNQPVWTYTHAHNVPRDAWGKVSVLRSCEKLEQVEKAFEDGFAAAMVVEEFEDTAPYEVAPGIIGIPCREQTGHAPSCDECRLCFRDDILRDRKRVILFAAHSSRAKTVKQMLRVINK